MAIGGPSFFTWGVCDVHGVGEVAVSLHRGKGCLHGCHEDLLGEEAVHHVERVYIAKSALHHVNGFRWSAKALPHVNEVFDATQCLHGVPGIRPS